MIPLPITRDASGVQLAVRVTARARRSEIKGVIVIEDGRRALAVRLAAPPVEGAANKALIAMIADHAGLAASRITIRSGETARLKILHLAGDGDAIVAALERAVGAANRHDA